MMIGQDIAQQMQLFAKSVFVGAGICLLYDLLRGFRRAVSHGRTWIAVEDVCFWVLSAVGIFLFVCHEDDGKVRGFVLLGNLLGMSCYHILMSRTILRASSAFFGFWRKIVVILHKFWKKALKKIREKVKIKKGIDEKGGK